MTSPKLVPSRAERVTFFEDRAEVVRVARATLAAGRAWVALEGVSSLVDERSVQARVRAGAARVVGARARWSVTTRETLGREAAFGLEEEARRAEEALAAARGDVTRAKHALVRVETVHASLLEALQAAPVGLGRDDGVAHFRAALAEIDAEVEALMAAAREAERAYAAATEARDAASARLALSRREDPTLTATVEVEVEVEADGEVGLEATYRVPCAVWRPEHLARLESGDGQARVELTTFAVAWQCTGERWEDVRARFSTARPARAATAPLLEDDVLAARRKTDEARRRVEVEAREQAVAVTGVSGAREVEEMPGVDDGGEPLVLEARGPVTLPSDGQLVRVEVERRTLAARVELVLVSEVANAAHVRASATLGAGGPLLAGPVRVVRGQSLMGRSRVGFVARGEPFELGFGADDGVRVRRAVEEQRDTTALTGAQRVKRTVRVFLGNLASEPRRVRVRERIPVSEIDDVKVDLGEAEGFALDGKDGLLERVVDLPARGTAELRYVYELRAGARVVLPF